MLNRLLGFCKKKRVTVFVGAGAAVELHPCHCTTSELTRLVQTHTESGHFITEMAESLRTYFGTDTTVNFEDIYQAMEERASLSMAFSPQNIRSYRPALGAFLGSFVNQESIDAILDDSYNMRLYRATIDLLNEVRLQINRYDEVYQSAIENSWHRDFFQSLSKRATLSVATLNYDTCFEQILDRYEDGFADQVGVYKKFNAKALRNTSKHKVLHLHGAINYGFRPHGDRTPRIVPDLIPDLIKYDSYSLASAQSIIEYAANQAGYSCQLSSIITGLNKTDKLISIPFIYYTSELINSIYQNPSLLIIGYSFGDRHINRILDEMTSIHGENRRIVIIDMIPDIALTHYEQAGDEIDHKKYISIKKAFNQKEHLRISINGPAPGPFISEDQCARVYNHGLRDAVTKHHSSIIDFLISNQ